MLWDTNKTRRRCGGCTGRSLADAEGTIRKLALNARFFAARRSSAGVRAWIAGHPHGERGHCDRGADSSCHSWAEPTASPLRSADDPGGEHRIEIRYCES